MYGKNKYLYYYLINIVNHKDTEFEFFHQNYIVSHLKVCFASS